MDVKVSKANKDYSETETYLLNYKRLRCLRVAGRKRKRKKGLQTPLTLIIEAEVDGSWRACTFIEE